MPAPRSFPACSTMLRILLPTGDPLDMFNDLEIFDRLAISCVKRLIHLRSRIPTVACATFPVMAECQSSFRAEAMLGSALERRN